MEDFKYNMVLEFDGHDIRWEAEMDNAHNV